MGKNLNHSFVRTLNLPELLNKKSFFLFGPRAVGKTYLIRKQLAERSLVLNLLHSEVYLRLSENPSLLSSMIDGQQSKGNPDQIVVIDEIQKVPALLDEVHHLMEERRIKFLLTGSSARKLKRGQANLLAGRAWTANLFPLTSNEIENFDLDHYLRWGGLPGVTQSESPEEELHAYVNTYLYEEIQAEGLVRKLPQFSRFLKAASLTHGQLINFANIASDTGVPATTVKEYYSILEDTLLGFVVPPWTGSKKRKAIATAKFYLFDPGVAHTLCGTRSLERNSDLYGISFEHWVAMELKAYLSYRRKHLELKFWRSTHQQEVDFVIGEELAIEVKSTQRVAPKHLSGLLALKEEQVFKKFILVSQDPIDAVRDGIDCMHWKTFCAGLWADHFRC